MCGEKNTISLEIENDYVYVDRCVARRHTCHLLKIPVSDFEKIEDIISFFNNIELKDPYPSYAGEIQNFICDGEKVCPSIEHIEAVNIDFITECNCHCVFCNEKDYIARNKVSHKELYFNTLNKLKNKNLTIKTTHAGEPLFYLEDFKYFLKNLKKGDFKQIKITTNGTLIDNEFCEIIKEARNNVDIEIAISVNAACRETRKKLMHVDDFDRVAVYVYKLNALASAYAPVLTENELKRFKKLFPNHVIIP